MITQLDLIPMKLFLTINDLSLVLYYSTFWKNWEFFEVKRMFALLVIVVIAFLFSGCTNDDSNTDSMTDLDINYDFNFTSNREVSVDFNAVYDGVFYIYDLEDNLLSKRTC